MVKMGKLISEMSISELEIFKRQLERQVVQAQFDIKMLEIQIRQRKDDETKKLRCP